MSDPIKMMLLGDSGAGKTGALVSLIKAGYRVHVLDLDNGTDIIRNMLRGDPAIANFSTVLLTDGFRVSGVNIIPTANAYGNLIKALGDYKPETRGDKDILVLDSLTFAGRAAVRFVLNLNGRVGDLPGWNDYLTAQGLLDKLLAALYSETTKCNVIVLSHVREISKTRQEMDSKGRMITVEEEGTRKGYAETGAGKALSPTIGRFFNSVLLADIEGSGQAARRIIRTVPHENIGLKNSNPAVVRPFYPLATGLADYFSALRGQPGTNQ